MRRSAAFGKADFLLWGPTIIFVATSTTTVGVLVHLDVMSLVPSLAAYSVVLAIGSTVSFGFLLASWLATRRHFNTLAPNHGSWPPPGKLQQRDSFSTEDVDALKDGSSWFTSIYGSRGETMSSFSFLTTRTAASRPRPVKEVLTSCSTLLNKSSYSASPAISGRNAEARDFNGPPVQSVSALYRLKPLAELDSSPFAQEVSSRASSDFTRQSAETRHSLYQYPAHAVNSRTSFSSENAGKSWLTSPTHSQATLTEWSFPTATNSPSTPSLQLPKSNVFVTRSPEMPATPALPATPGFAMSPNCSTPDPFLRSYDRDVSPPSEGSSPALRGYGSCRERSLSEIEQGRKLVTKRVPRSLGVVGWLISTWVPLVSVFEPVYALSIDQFVFLKGLSLPYLLMYSRQHGFASQNVPTMLVLSVTISSPLLALCLAFNAPLSGTLTGRLKRVKIPRALMHGNDLPEKSCSKATNFHANTGAHTRVRLVATSVTSPSSNQTSPDRQPSINMESKGKLWRTLNLLSPTPSLIVVPSTNAGFYDVDMDIEPYLPKEGQANAISIPTVEIISEDETNKRISAEDHSHRLSKASSYESGCTDAGLNTRIEVARRHYSTLAHAQAITITPSPTRSSFAELHPNQHIRFRPNSNISIQSSLHTRSSSVPLLALLQNSAPTPPPTDPLPPTPDSIKYPHTRARSSGYLLSSIRNVRGLEVIMPSLLPHLVPHPSPTETDAQSFEDWESIILSGASSDGIGRTHMGSPQRAPRGVPDVSFLSAPGQPLYQEGKVPAQPSSHGVSPLRPPKPPVVPEYVPLSFRLFVSLIFVHAGLPQLEFLTEMS